MDLPVNQIIQGDCLEVMKGLPDKCIDLTVTSPPYDNLRDYNNKVTWNFEKFKEVAKELFRITKPGGVVVWVVGDATIKGSETGTSFRQALFFMKCGFNLHDTMIYQKNAMPFPEQTRYIQCFEYMFVMSKGKPKSHNMIKEPTRVANRIKNKKSCQRNKDGTTTPMKYETGKNERNKWNVWVYEVGYNKTTKDKEAFQHPAMFPEALARDHIISWSNKGDLVLDPFVGSGTTAKMALLNGRNYIGIDISEEYCEIAKKRVSNLQQKLFIV
jgi:site-specific DNA-methyltransferase (adenine-specific)